MIDRKAFSDEWDFLCNRFVRQNNPQEARRYYEWLTGRLSTDQFQEAAKDLWARSEFFPRPEAFVDVVRGKRDGLWVQPLPPKVKLLPPPRDVVTGQEVRKAFEAQVPGYRAWRKRTGEIRKLERRRREKIRTLPTGKPARSRR